MVRKVITVDTHLCTGCRVCELICSLTKEGECNPRKSRIRVLKSDVDGFDFPLTCQHCGDPLCKDICPVDALSRDSETGGIVLNEKKCIGCRACILACPFGAIGFDYELNIAKKCDLCGGDPMCVKFCETHALRYESSELAEMRKQNKIRDSFSGILGTEKSSVHVSA